MKPILPLLGNSEGHGFAERSSRDKCYNAEASNTFKDKLNISKLKGNCDITTSREKTSQYSTNLASRPDYHTSKAEELKQSSVLTSNRASNFDGSHGLPGIPRNRSIPAISARVVP